MKHSLRYLKFAGAALMLAGTALVLTGGIAWANALIQPDAVVGAYWTDDRDTRIEVFERGGKYGGKIVWEQEASLDDNNPDESLRTRPLVGLEFMKNFVFDGDDTWEDGTIYSPDNGSTYSAMMWLEDGNLQLKGYIGISLFGRTATLYRDK